MLSTVWQTSKFASAVRGDGVEANTAFKAGSDEDNEL